jgi:nitrite reductase (NO-forming)
MKRILVLMVALAFASSVGIQAKPDKAKIMKMGEKVYVTNCSACHQVTGLGIPGVFPPLAKSDFINGDVNVIFHSIFKGNEGEMTVNGVKYNVVMPPVALKNKEAAAVATYIMNSWGNEGKIYSPKKVKKWKKKHMKK